MIVIFITYFYTLKSGNIMRALIVDDNDQILDALSFMMESNSVDSTIAHNGRDALDLIYNGTNDPESAFDIIFLDLAMPEMSGFQVIEELYTKGLLKGLKVVVITALELAPEDEKDILEKGVTSILKKPFLIEDIEKLLLS